MKIFALCSMSVVAIPALRPTSGSGDARTHPSPDTRTKSSGSANLGIVHTTQTSVAGSTPVALSLQYLAFLADEPTHGPGGTDLNGDGDVIDSVAYGVETAPSTETNLGVAATALAWIGSELYLVVDEALDGRNWEPADTGDRLVLLHWSAGALLPVDYVDRVASSGSTKMIAVGSNLFYSSARVPTLAQESNLQVIQSATPLSPIPIATQDLVGPLSPRLLAVDDGLIFLALDETVETRDLNGDTDVTDSTVLALLDGTGVTSVIRSTELAIPTASPLRAKRTSSSSHDWQVGFLVSESDQGVTNRNDPSLFAASWAPPQCAGAADIDALDDVLHFLEFPAWDTDPITNPPVNTGLVGCRKIAMANGYIATITPELGAPEASAEGSCDLNADGDLNDYVVRWVQKSTPVLPLTPATNIHALADPPGGTHGLAELDDRFVIEVSEADDDLDINGDALKTFELLGWLSPSGSSGANTPWDFTHGNGNSTFVGSSWTREQPDRTRLNVALEEKVEGVNINAHVPPVAGEDLDALDSVPTFADIAGGPPGLVFPGIAIAVDTANAGIVIARSIGFYRVDEAEDSRDWNADGDEIDFILFSTSLTTGVPTSMGTSSSLPGRLAIEVNLDETPQIAAFFVNEQLQGPGGTDFNNDGDTGDLVIGWFLLASDCNNNNIPEDVDISNGTEQDCNGNGIPDSCDIASGTSTDQNGNGVPDSCESVAGTPYCFGDLSGAVCPCGNIGAIGHGCRNSVGQSAQLSASGLTNPDIVELLSVGELPNALTLFVQGNATVAAVPFGDGLRCVSGTLKRLYWKIASSGQCSAPGAGDPPITVRSAALGDPIQSGEARFYMTYYRDPDPLFCPIPQGSTFNASNALFIVW